MTRPGRTLLWGVSLLVGLILVWFLRRVLLLTFAGILIALIFTSILNQVRRWIPMRQGLGVALVLVFLLGLGALVGLLLAPGLATQFSELAQRLPQSFAQLQDRAEGTAVYQTLTRSIPDLKSLASSSTSIFSRVSSLFASTFDTLAGLLLLLFVGLFLAGNPRLYEELLLRLVPPTHRDDGRAILKRVLCVLKYWLLGQVISMCLIGTLVGVSFALAGLPLSTSLGVLAGIGEFIPFVGPLLAAVPALLLALSRSGEFFLVVLAIYVGIQFAEGHLIMPVVQRSTVNLPPVLTLIAVYALGEAFGLLGMFVAAPLTAVVLVLVEEIYIRRYLGEKRELLES